MTRRIISIRSNRGSHGSRHIYRQVGLAVVMGVGVTTGTLAMAQQPPPAEQNSQDVQQVDSDNSTRRALAYYANAADYQNSGAFELAIEEWRKLVDQFPDDPQASTAWHHLGVCNLQRDEPDYQQAIDAFQQAVQDEQLELRHESLINLSWALFAQARRVEDQPARQKELLTSARDRLTEFLKSYSDGGYVDQALFHLGDIEHLLGNQARSIAYFKKFVDTASLNDSSLRPDALYALAVGYEETDRRLQAERYYEDFLKQYSNHRLTGEVRLRLADSRLAAGKATEAETLLRELLDSDPGNLADYAQLRLAFALQEQSKTEEAQQAYAALLRDYPDSAHAASAALSLGQLYYRQQEFEQALEYFEQTLPGKDSQASEAAHWMATIFLQQDRPEQALELLDDIDDWASQQGNSVTLSLDYADALYALPQRLDEAQSAYARIAEEHPEHSLAPRAAYNAAFAALQTGDLNQARRWAERFLNRYPQDALRNDVAYVAAEALLQQGEHQAAVTAYQRLLGAASDSPETPHWTLRLGMALYLSGDYAQAIELLGPQADAFETAEARAEAYFILGASELYRENFKPAVQQLEASRQTDQQWPSADEALIMLTEAYQRDRNLSAAREVLEEFLQSFPDSRLRHQAKYKLAQLSASVGEFTTAIEGYRELVADQQASNYHNFARYGIAWCRMQQERYAQALEELQPLLEQRLRDTIGSEARLAQGMCLRKLGRLEEAVTALEAFLETDPQGDSRANALYELGMVLTESEQLEEANRRFSQLLEASPEHGSTDKVLYELAWNYQELGSAEQALERFRQLAEGHPDSELAAEANYMLGQELYETEDFVQAAGQYELVSKRAAEPELREKALYKLGWSWFKQEQFARAAKIYAEQTESFPGSELTVDGLFMNGECWFEQDEFERAFEHYQRARQLLEQSSHKTAASQQVRTLIHLHGGQALRELERWEEGEQWLRMVVEHYADGLYLPVALYELGYCKQKQGKTAEALKYYAEVADNYRNAVAARARFMMGEIHFAQRDFVKAIPEFQRVMYGFGGAKATDEIKNWQAKSAFEAARCSEVLIQTLQGSGRQKVLDTATEFYQFIVDKHAAHDLAAQAQSRLGELRKLR